MIPAYRISADSSLPYNLPKAPYSVQVITIFHNGFSAESTNNSFLESFVFFFPSSSLLNRLAEIVESPWHSRVLFASARPMPHFVPISARQASVCPAPRLNRGEIVSVEGSLYLRATASSRASRMNR